MGFISYLKLNGGLDNFARILFYSAMFLVLLLLTQYQRFAKIEFFMSWWAYSFPLAASSIAAQLMYVHSENEFFWYLSVALLTLASCVIAMLLSKTLLALARKQICVAE